MISRTGRPTAGHAEGSRREPPLRLVVVVASARKGRNGGCVAQWFLEQTTGRSELEVDTVDTAVFPLPPEPHRDPDPTTAQVLSRLTPRLRRADMFVFVVPEYNRSFPASVKSLIDWHTAEWEAKPVGFVSYGGRSGGLRAVEHLGQVFTELHAVTVRNTVSFHSVEEQFDSEGRPKSPEACAVAAQNLLDQLVWWGRALRRAREESPYRGSARDIRSQMIEEPQYVR